MASFFQESYHLGTYDVQYTSVVCLRVVSDHSGVSATSDMLVDVLLFIWFLIFSAIFSYHRCSPGLNQWVGVAVPVDWDNPWEETKLWVFKVPSCLFLVIQWISNDMRNWADWFKLISALESKLCGGALNPPWGFFPPKSLDTDVINSRSTVHSWSMLLSQG